MAFLLAEKLNESGKQEMRNRGIGISEMDGKAARGAVRSAGARSTKRNVVISLFAAAVLS